MTTPTQAWQYCGDINIRHGGYYWREDGASDYVLAVECIPCSVAGGPDNQFFITIGSVFLGDENKQSEALTCIGIDASEATRAHYVDAAMAYRGIESDENYVLQIGAKPESHGPGWHECDDPLITHGNCKLRKYVRGLLHD